MSAHPPPRPRRPPASPSSARCADRRPTPTRAHRPTTAAPSTSMPVPSLTRVGGTTDNGDHTRSRGPVRGSGGPVAGAGDQSTGAGKRSAGAGDRPAGAGMRSAGARGPCPPGQETGPRAPRRQGSGGVQPTGSTETGSVIAPALGATTGIREPPRPAFLHPTTRPPGVPLRHARVSHPHPPLLARPTPRRFAQPASGRAHVTRTPTAVITRPPAIAAPAPSTSRTTTASTPSSRAAPPTRSPYSTTGSAVRRTSRSPMSRSCGRRTRTANSRAAPPRGWS